MAGLAKGAGGRGRFGKGAAVRWRLAGDKAARGARSMIGKGRGCKEEISKAAWQGERRQMGRLTGRQGEQIDRGQ